MSGPKRNPDRINTIGIVVIGICGAVLTYVSIVALQAFYMNDSAPVQTMADYGGQDLTFRGQRAEQLNYLNTPAPNPGAAEASKQTYRVPIDDAIKLIVASAKTDVGALVPTQGRSDKPTIQPIFGRPKPLAGAAPAPADGAGSAAAPVDGAAPQTTGAAAPADGAAPGAGAGSGGATQPPSAPMTPTGGTGPGGGPAKGQADPAGAGAGPTSTPPPAATGSATAPTTGSGAG